MFEPPRRHFDRKFRVERSSPAQVLRQVYANANTKPPLAPGFKFMIGNDFFRGSRVPRMNAFVRGPSANRVASAGLAPRGLAPPRYLGRATDLSTSSPRRRRETRLLID